MPEDFIVIRKKKIPTKKRSIEVNKLRFYRENPRIYSLIGVDDSESTQEDIQATLIKMGHVKELVQDIYDNGGLIDPIIVKDGTHEVLEGNSRLAAYWELIKKDPIYWGEMPCIVLPKDIDEASVFALLGQYHIKGKKDWQAFEQGGFLHRRHTRQKVSVEHLARELGLGVTDARNLIDTYEYMDAKEIRDPAKWSHCYEFIRSRKMKKVRRKNLDFDDVIAEKISSGSVGKSQDFRDGLKILGDAKPKMIKKFVDGEYTFDEAINAVQTSGNASEVYKRFKRFRSWLNKEETQDAIKAASTEEAKKIVFEISKLHIIIKRINEK